jgi:hypothetical protein
MPMLHLPFTLRLYGHVLCCLCNHNFTGLDLFYRIKDCWKRRDKPIDLLLRPLEPGLSLKIGEWCFDTLFDVDGKSESMDKPYFKRLDPENFVWFLDDVVEAAFLSGFFGDAELLSAMAVQIESFDGLYETNEAEYLTQIEKGGRRDLIRKFSEFCHDLRGPISRMRETYAYEVADRILHDRQLCNFIAQTIMNIGFDGETAEGLRAQWVDRERWPIQIKKILHARDRGKCAACNTDIVLELREEAHIDHMFPLARGGCNDLVNLQLLCSTCNRKKSDRDSKVTSSVPQYIRRPRERAVTKRSDAD